MPTIPMTSMVPNSLAGLFSTVTGNIFNNQSPDVSGVESNTYYSKSDGGPVQSPKLDSSFRSFFKDRKPNLDPEDPVGAINMEFIGKLLMASMPYGVLYSLGLDPEILNAGIAGYSALLGALNVSSVIYKDWVTPSESISQASQSRMGYSNWVSMASAAIAIGMNTDPNVTPVFMSGLVLPLLYSALVTNFYDQRVDKIQALEND